LKSNEGFVILKKEMPKKIDKLTYKRRLLLECECCKERFYLTETMTIWGKQVFPSSCPNCKLPYSPLKLKLAKQKPITKK